MTWRLNVEWGSGRGDVRVQDPATGEWHELESDVLADENPCLDLRWLRRLAAERKRSAIIQKSQQRSQLAAELMELLESE